MRYLLDGEETERLYLRKIQYSDFNLWLPFFQDPGNFRHWIPDQGTPWVACERWYQKQFHRYENDLGGMNALIEKKSGQLIGHCGLLLQTVDAIAELEVGYSLLPQFWSMGFASEAAFKCRDFAFENNLTETLISIISTTNIPSEKVALKNGMLLEKTTLYHNNKVNIYRIDKIQWQQVFNNRTKGLR